MDDEAVTITIVHIVGTLMAVVTGAAAIVNFAYDTFQTKESSDQRVLSIEKRLERIEDKIDRLSESSAFRKRN